MRRRPKRTYKVTIRYAIVLYSMERLSWKRWLAWCACCLTLAACTQQAPQEGDGHAPNASAGQGGSGGGGGVASGQASSAGAGGAAMQDDEPYRVELRAGDTTLCPGQCTTLVAEVENGTPPYAYAWNQADLDGAGPFEVCPSRTTSFEVVATDAFSTLEEFGGEDRQATGTLQLVVTDDCEQPASDGEPPIDVEPGQPICELRVTSTSTSAFRPSSAWGALRNMNADAQGNLYFVGTIHGGTIQIGDMSVEGNGDNPSGLVVKLSPSCEPLWLKPLHALSGSLWLTALAVSPSGDDIYVTGGVEGSVSFAGKTIDVGGDDSGLLFRLDGQGEVIWVEGATGSPHTRINDVAIADDGEVIVTGFTLDGGSFAGLSLGTDSMTYSAFVARVQPNGTATFLHTIRRSVEDLSVLLLPSGSLALMGSGYGTAPQELAGGVIEGAGDGWNVFVAVLEAGGDFVWGKAVRRGPQDGWTSFVPTTMTLDRSGNLLIDESHYEDSPSGTIVSTPPELIRIDAAGNELWSRERPYLRLSGNQWSGGLAVDTANNILVADEVLDGTVTEDGQVLDANGVNDFMLSKRTADGELIWRWHSGGADLDWCLGIVPDAQDAIWFGYGSTDLETSDAELVIARIAP